MKQKRLRAKKLLNILLPCENNKAEEAFDTHTETNDFSTNKNISQYPKYSKDYHKLFNEIKVIRNRIAAQKSRDKKRIENESIKEMYQKVIDENISLKTLVSNQQSEINLLKSQLNELCVDCSHRLEGKSLFAPDKTNSRSTISNSDSNMYIEREDFQGEPCSAEIEYISNLKEDNAIRFSPLSKLGVFGSLLVVICIIAVFSILGEDDSSSKVIDGLSKGGMGNLDIGVGVVEKQYSEGIMNFQSKVIRRILYNKDLNNNENTTFQLNYNNYFNLSNNDSQDIDNSFNPYNKTEKIKYEDNLPQEYKKSDYNMESYMSKFLK